MTLEFCRYHTKQEQMDYTGFHEAFQPRRIEPFQTSILMLSRAQTENLGLDHRHVTPSEVSAKNVNTSLENLVVFP